MPRALSILVVLVGLPSLLHAADKQSDAPDWPAGMKAVHAKFTGKPGTFAQFGDSITVTLAYWTPLLYERKNLDSDAQKDLDLVNRTMQKACWRDWKGPRFGSDGGQTIRWAAKNIDQWLKDLNPETALIMFGTNDLNSVPPAEYEALTREVVGKCLADGTVVILSTIPPRSGKVEQSKEFAQIVRKIAKELKVPLLDYQAEILKRRPTDWDGSAAAFKDANDKDVYNVTTLISRDGVHPSAPKSAANDYSADALSQHGYGLRGYLTLRAYAGVVREVLQPTR